MGRSKALGRRAKLSKYFPVATQRHFPWYTYVVERRKGEESDFETNGNRVSRKSNVMEKNDRIEHEPRLMVSRPAAVSKFDAIESLKRSTQHRLDAIFMAP